MLSFKKIALGALLMGSLSGNSVHALFGLTTDHSCSAFSGLLLGVYTGHSSFSTPLRIAHTTQGNFYQGNLNPQGLLGGLSLAYNRLMFYGFSIGLDVDCDWRNGKKKFLATTAIYNAGTEKNEMVSVTGSLERIFSWGVSAKIGHAIGNILPFLRLGFTSTEASFKSESYHFGKSKFGKNMPGFKIGFGMDASIGSRFIMGLEYQFVDYKKHKVKGFNQFKEVSYTTTLNPQENLALISFKVKLV